MINELTTVTTGSWRQSPDYARVMEHLQKGEWAEAAGLLGYLMRDYPGDPDLEALFAETQLRLETEQSHKGQRRKRALPNRRVFFVPILIAVLAALGLLAVNLYRWVITPAMLTQQSEALQAVLAKDAQQALAAGDYDRSLAIWDQLSSVNDKYPELAEGRAQAKQAKELAEAYELAQSQMAANALTDAQATLIGIQQIAPAYRDVNVLLTRIERQQRLTGLVNQAVTAVEAQDWEEVAARLEEARSLAQPQNRAVLEADLYDAYLNLGAQVISGSGGRPTEVQRGLDIYNKALALRPQEPQATMQRDLAKAYLDGYEATKNSDWEAAVEALEPLYAAQPGYVNSEAARMLYNAYMRSGDEYFAQVKYTHAWDRYFRASQLQGVDTHTAQALAANLAANVTPTVAPQPNATPTPLPSVRGAGGAPVPANSPLARYQGKIAFLSNRSGKQAIWIMDVDGQNAFQAVDQAKAQEEYNRLREAETKSPDGQRAVYVTTPADEANPQVFIALPDSTATRVTDLDGLNADPVWAPTGHWIAFVSNQPGNDEIFVVGADGKNLKRVTENSFEWDKHPSWSPDATRLVFWSNRGSSTPQIWVTNQDGSNPVNLSRNRYDERDPIWIK